MCVSWWWAKWAGQRSAASTWPNTLMVEIVAAISQNKGTSPNKDKKQRQRKGGNHRQRREVMRGGENAAEWLNYFFHFCVEVRVGEMCHPVTIAHCNSLLTAMTAGVLVFLVTACCFMWTLIIKGLMCKGKERVGSLGCMTLLFNKNNTQ